MLGLSILPSELLERPGQALLFALKPRLACPGALQIIATAEVQPAESIDLQFDLVAILEAGQATVIGAHGEDVPRIERVDG